MSGKRRRIAGFVLLVALAAAGCKRYLNSPTGPSDAWRQSFPSWSPYVVLQPDTAAINGYHEALVTLANAGAVKGVRVGLYRDGRSVAVVNQAASLGLEVVGIIDNADLFQTDVEQVFDDYRALYPQVKIFQVGNEITTLSPPMGIETYIAVLARVYAHVVAAYSDVTLISESGFGAGIMGASELAMTGAAARNLGLSSSRLILGINVYTETAIAAYTQAISSLPAGFRVWVMETGTPDPSGQVAWVTQTYPRLQDQLHAERMYWYALWAGDTGGDSGYSLIKNAASPPILAGPLFQQLITVH